MTKQTLTASKEAGSGIVVRVGEQVIATLRDCNSLVRNIDKAAESAGFVRTSGFFPMGEGYELTLVAEVGSY